MHSGRDALELQNSSHSKIPNHCLLVKIIKQEKKDRYSEGIELRKEGVNSPAA